jgi:hypothetical protein
MTYVDIFVSVVIVSEKKKKTFFVPTNVFWFRLHNAVALAP